MWCYPNWTTVEQCGTPISLLWLMNSRAYRSSLGKLSARTGKHPTPVSSINANGNLCQHGEDYKKLKVCYNIMNNLSIISPSTFPLHPSPSPRHPHNRILLMPLTKTNSHRFSFFCGRSTTLEFPPFPYNQQSLTYHLQTSSLRTCTYLWFITQIFNCFPYYVLFFFLFYTRYYPYITLYYN